MISRKSVCAIAAGAALLAMTAGCGSDDSSDSAASTTSAVSSSAHAAHSSAGATASSLGATASSIISSAMNSAQQGIQSAINAALSAAPISFDSGSSDLSAVDEVTIKAVAVPLKGNDTHISVTTYAQGDNADEAKALAEARGNNIAAALTAEGIDKERITVRTETNPTGSDVQVDQAKIEVTHS